jgi:hypothetical protein
MFNLANNLFDCRSCERVKNDYYLLDEKIIDLDSKIKELFRDKFKLNLDQAQSGSRLLIKGNMYHSSEYNRKKNTNNQTCLYSDSKYGRIAKFLKVKEACFVLMEQLETEKILWPSSDSQLFAILNEFNLLDRYYVKVRRHELNLNVKYDLININELKSKCLELEIKEDTYLTMISYEYEHD